MNAFAIGHGYVKQAALTTQAALTIEQFCEAHRISRTHLHNMTKAGKGPRVMRLGRRVLISAEAAADWRHRLEQESATAAA
jgi:hypothetical protein